MIKFYKVTKKIKKMIETEYKFEIQKEDIKHYQEVLKKLGFTQEERMYEKNTMFDNPNEIMQQTNGRIRLRSIKGVHSTKYEFCYKKPLANTGGPKQEIEYQVEFQDGDENFVKILNMMEFTESTSYERYRTKIKSKNIEVVIDEYPFACFIEIEGEEYDIKEIAKKIGFSLEQHLNEPCDTLFSNWRNKKGLRPTKHMRFNDFNK